MGILAIERIPRREKISRRQRDVLRYDPRRTRLISSSEHRHPFDETALIESIVVAQIIKQAIDLHTKVNRENVMIKIPATLEGLPAITEVIGRGISVNVTLIFSIARYEAVINAYFAGLKKALSEGIDISKIHSVASFFVSRVDTEVDKRLVGIGREDLRSKAAIANAQLAYELFLKKFSKLMV